MSAICVANGRGRRGCRFHALRPFPPPKESDHLLLLKHQTPQFKQPRFTFQSKTQITFHAHGQIKKDGCAPPGRTKAEAPFGMFPSACGLNSAAGQSAAVVNVPHARKRLGNGAARCISCTHMLVNLLITDDGLAVLCKFIGISPPEMRMYALASCARPKVVLRSCALNVLPPQLRALFYKAAVCSTLGKSALCC